MGFGWETFAALAIHASPESKQTMGQSNRKGCPIFCILEIGR